MDLFDERKLLNYNTYEDYLDSFATTADLNYLRSTLYTRMIAGLGYRSTGETLSKSQFYTRKEAIREALFPTRKPHILCSDGCTSTDPLIQELALRERANRVLQLSTIISLRLHTKKGDEISGYIDFEDSLRRLRMQEPDATDWYDIFAERKRLRPTSKDMGYFHWRSGHSVTNCTQNYEVIADPTKGLIFVNKHDRKYIIVDPALSSPGSNTTRNIIHSEKYDHIILYDHITRVKI